MNCEAARRALSLAVDGELADASIEAELADHVQECPDCRVFEQQMRSLRSQLRFEPVAETPDVAPRVLDALRPTRRILRPRVGLVAAVAAVAGILMGVAVTSIGFEPRGSVQIGPGADSGIDVLLAWTPDELDPALAPAVENADGVRANSVVRAGVVDLVGSRDSAGHQVDALEPGWSIPLDVIAVDPDDHAAFAPLADRKLVAELDAEEALLSRTSAELRGLTTGSTIELASGEELKVTSIVDDTTIGASELAVSYSTGERLGVETVRYLLVAHDGDHDRLERTMSGAVADDTEVRFRSSGETPFLRHGDAVLPPAELKERFGEFAYRRPSEGAREFKQSTAWQANKLVERDVPLVGHVRCHQQIVTALEGALAEIEASNLGESVGPRDFAGCWNPRLIDAGGDLSHHAWGVAFDLDVDDQRAVEILENWGFTWGGDWLVPDPSHFEIGP